jgi:hypothetical protein
VRRIEEAIPDPGDIANHLINLMGGGVEQRDEILVIGLILGVAQPVWREDNLIPEQIAGVHVLLSPTEAEVDLYPLPSH